MPAGRGKAGGIRLCRDEHEVWEAADALLGKRLVTHQTDAKGKLIHRLYIEAATEITREFYLGFVLDRKAERVVLVASSAGGMEIEEITRERPESLVRSSIDPAVGMQPFQAREVALALGFDTAHMAIAVEIILGCYRAFRELDATMVEINPLVATHEGDLVALDAKMSFDDNALFRRPRISGAARQVTGRSAGIPRRRSWAELCRSHRLHRLHHQRRRPCHGDHGCDQASLAASPPTSSILAAVQRLNASPRLSAWCSRMRMSRRSWSTSSPA
jgi:succinyl-CoA synthetase beta subunit